MSEIIPVIHMLNRDQVFANVYTCLDVGIHKVFVINHAVSETELLNCAWDLQEAYDDNLWVGINPLGVQIADAVNTEYVLDGLWCDGTMTKSLHKQRTFKGLLFSGVAFKYQPQPKDLQKACQDAMQVTDVVTTSGFATGKPASLDKLLRMREYLGDFPLAVASGVSINNIDNYRGLVDYLLVASSITDDKEMIIKDKLYDLHMYLQPAGGQTKS